MSPKVEAPWDCVKELSVPVYLHPRIPLPNQQRMYKGYEGLLGSLREPVRPEATRGSLKQPAAA
jgi:hypothetical protein